MIDLNNLPKNAIVIATATLTAGAIGAVVGTQVGDETVIYQCPPIEDKPQSNESANPPGITDISTPPIGPGKKIKTGFRMGEGWNIKLDTISIIGLNKCFDVSTPVITGDKEKDFTIEVTSHCDFPARFLATVEYTCDSKNENCPVK